MNKLIAVAIIVVIAVVGVAILQSFSGDVEPEELPEGVVAVDWDNVTENSGIIGWIQIGSIYPLTGDLSTHGIENLEGAKFGVSEFNKYLDELGEPWELELISEDSATNPVIALEKLTTLHSKNIDIIIGPETSSNIRNIKGYADSNNMLLVSCCSTAQSLAIPDDSVYRLVADDSNQGVALGKVIDDANIEVMVPIWRADTWGDGLTESTSASFVSRGGMVDEGIRYNPEAPEFSASTSLLADKVQGYVDEHGADKVGILFIGFSEILQFQQSASQHEILNDVRWFGPAATTKDHKLVEDPIGSEFATDVSYTSVQLATNENPTYLKVQQHIVDTLGRSPSTFSHSSYDAVWIVGLAMLETGETDAASIKAAIPGVAASYENSALGDTTLNEAGDLQLADYEVWGVRDGEWMRLGLYTASEDSVSFE